MNRVAYKAMKIHKEYDTSEEIKEEDEEAQHNDNAVPSKID